MATRYVGPGGNDGNNGLTWALRKLTLNGVEDTPVVAGDLIYVGPGVYRELLICDVSGGVGTEIVYVGDVTGEHTDSVGGVVRITGSDNDQTSARAQCVDFVNKAGRTFRGFYVDMASGQGFRVMNNCVNILIEDCVFLHNGDAIATNGNTQSTTVIKRCFFISNKIRSVFFTAGATVDNSGHLIENCVSIGQHPLVGVFTTNRVGGIIIRNCTVIGPLKAVRVGVALTVGQTVTVENCILQCCTFALEATVLGEIIENFNTFHNNNVDRTNVAVGGNSVSYPALLSMPLLYSGVGQISGYGFPWWFGELSEWSQVQAITGANEPTEDLRGIARPVTASKNSWGAIQFPDMERETGTVRTGSVSMVLHDAGRHQIWVPVEASSTTIRVYVRREANYAGNLPQMIIKQPGVADRITTDVGLVNAWNLLTDTFVPQAIPPYVVVELVSRNTNGAADEVFFDDLDVS